MKRLFLLAMLLSGAALAEEDPSNADFLKASGRSHFYEEKIDRDYLYNPAVSDDDARAGRKANPYIKARYLGNVGGKYTVQVREGVLTQLIECADPCKIYKISILLGKRVFREELIPNVQGTLGSLMLDDAMHGRLEVDAAPAAKGKK